MGEQSERRRMIQAMARLQAIQRSQLVNVQNPLSQVGVGEAHAQYSRSNSVPARLTLNIEQKEYVTSNLVELWKSKDLSDVVFQCSDGREPIKAHKLVLSMGSPVFLAMFESGMCEAKTNVVKIEDLDQTALSKLLEYIYTGCINFTNTEEVINMIPAAEKYQLDKLKLSAFELLVTNMNVTNVGNLVVIAHTYNALDTVKLKIQEFLIQNRVELMKTPGFQDLTERYSAAFSNITYGTFTSN
jgi:hypothetical protein